jgi:hypothetical protein
VSTAFLRDGQDFRQNPSMLARQVRGIVVWYDSEKAYGYFVKRLSLSKQQFSHPRTALSP